MPATKKAKRSRSRRIALIKRIMEAKDDSPKDAAIAVGYSPETASTNAHAAIKMIRETYPDAIHRMGYGPEKIIAEVLAPALKANETRYFQAKGLVTDEREVINWETRLRAADLIIRASDTKKDNVPSNILIQVSILGQSDQSKVIDAQPVPLPIQHPQPPLFTSPVQEDPRPSSHSPDPEIENDCC